MNADLSCAYTVLCCKCLRCPHDVCNTPLSETSRDLADIFEVYVPHLSDVAWLCCAIGSPSVTIHTYLAKLLHCVTLTAAYYKRPSAFQYSLRSTVMLYYLCYAKLKTVRSVFYVRLFSIPDIVKYLTFLLLLR